MDKKNVSRRHRWSKPIPLAEYKEKCANGEIEVKDYCLHVITEDMTEEEIRKARNAGMREIYAAFQDGKSSVNYPGGFEQLRKEIESGMYDD